MRFGIIGLVCLWFGASVTASAQELVDISQLSLDQFTRQAIASDPQLNQVRKRASALRDRAVAASALPDPQVRLGLANIPTDSFSFEQEGMTQKVIGVNQAFPPFGALEHKRLEMEEMASMQDAMAEDRELMVIRGVRQSWLELYYQFKAVELIRRSEAVFDELVKISRLRYRQGRGTQNDILRAELELNMLEDRVAMIEIDKEKTLAELGSWLGAAQVRRTTPVQFPLLPALPTHDQIRKSMADHPSLVAARTRVSAGHEAVEAARAEYRPRTMVDFSFGQRDADPMGNDRAELISGMVSFSVPLYFGKRQNRLVQASRAEVEEAKDGVEAQRRKLDESLETEFRRYQLLDQRNQLFERQILPVSEQYAQISLKSYQSGVSDFTEQVRSRLAELENGLRALRLQVDRAKTHAALLYLAGDNTL